MKTNSKNESMQLILKTKSTENTFLKITFAVVIAVLLSFATVALKAQKYNGRYYNNVNAAGIILDGYDPVAFFTDNKPVRGDAAFQYNYDDATYYFASQEHLELFKTNPEKYKPQFGAWCAYAVSLGRTAPIDVSTFSIVNNRLVLQHNQRAVNGWNKDVKGNLALADKYWPLVTANGGKQINITHEKNSLYIWSIAVVVLLIFIYWRLTVRTERHRRSLILNADNRNARTKMQPRAVS